MVIIIIIAMLHFVLFHNVTWYMDSLLSRIHVNTTYLLNIMCTLVAAGLMLGRLECNLLLLLKPIFNPSMTNTCKFKLL